MDGEGLRIHYDICCMVLSFLLVIDLCSMLDCFEVYVVLIMTAGGVPQGPLLMYGSRYIYSHLSCIS